MSIEKTLLEVGYLINVNYVRLEPNIGAVEIYSSYLIECQVTGDESC